MVHLFCFQKLKKPDKKNGKNGERLVILEEEQTKNFNHDTIIQKPH